MPLTLKNKTPVKFEWNDGEVESSVTLQVDDDQETLVSKLKRVIHLVEGTPDLPVRVPGAALAWPTEIPSGPLFDAAGAEEAIKVGWGALAEEQLPEM